MDQFASLLKTAMGLDVESIGSQAIHRAVVQRQKAAGLPRLADYWDRVLGSEAELQELIEAIVVPETWFFRDQAAFTALGALAVEWRGRHPGLTLRVLSLPCSSGEEPYSMVMALLDQGLTPAQFRVEAVDISDRALALARAAVYGRNSFRGQELAFREKYFVADRQQYQLREEVRSRVQFRRGNLLADGFLPGGECYDVIFCRNVLIYFDEPTQQRALAALERWLAPEGWLFTGPSEAPLMVRHGFVSLKVPLAFAFRKKGQEEPVRPAKRKSTAVGAPLLQVSPGALTRRPMAPATPVSRPADSPPRPASAAPAPAGGLDAAEALANQGRLAEAAQVCEAQMREHGPSARACYILGLVRDAGEEPKLAEQLYRKALYLEPAHQEAMVHLALLLERAGDAAGARVFYERVKRSRQKLKPAGKH
jgi:chemotaxis protein methyltransferase WspC